MELINLSDNKPDISITTRIDLLLQLLHCNESIFYSAYDSDGALLSTNTEDPIYDTMIRKTGILNELLDKAAPTLPPHIISADAGITWCAVFEYRDAEEPHPILHLLGPTFTEVPSEAGINRIISFPAVSLHWRQKFANYLRNIPVIPATSLQKYTLMLHYCITEEYLQASDITVSRLSTTTAAPVSPEAASYSQKLAIEDQMMDLIRQGDIYYHSKISSTAVLLQKLYPLSDQDMPGICQSAAIFIGLCIRAGIDGGLSPDTACIKGEQYLRAVRLCENMVAILKLCHDAFEDFLFSVYNHQNLSSYSKEVQACIDYIETHCAEEIDLGQLARRIGYTDYYLSRKFKKDVGMSINSYIKKARIDQAAYLLISSDMSIQDISDRLHFGNRGFFSRTFKEYQGSSPAAFREAHRHKL